MSMLPPALLTYGVTPATVPVGEPVTLELAIANATGAYVPCAQIDISVATTGSDALTTDPSSIVAQPVTGTSWSISSDDAGHFTATPGGTPGLGKNASIAFLFKSVHVAPSEGLAAIAIVEQSGSPPEARSPVPLPAVTKTKPVVAITSFTAQPIAVCPGAQVLLSWSTVGAEHCVLSWPGGSKEGLPADFSDYAVNPQVETTYTLTAVGKGGSAHEYLPVAVLGTEIVDFFADPQTSPAAGKPCTLRWVIVNADTATIKPAVGTVDPNAGTHVVRPKVPTRYTLMAAGCNHHSEDLYLDVAPVEIVRFTARPQYVAAGQTVALDWATTGATGLSLTPGGKVPPQGSDQLIVETSTTFTLAASGYKPKKATAPVLVVPAITKISAGGSIIGDIIYCALSWETHGADAVTLNGAPVAASGWTPEGQGHFVLAATLGQTTTRVELDVAVDLDDEGEVDTEMTLSSDAGLNVPGGAARAEWSSDDRAVFQGFVTAKPAWYHEIPAGDPGGSVDVPLVGEGVLWGGQISGSDAEAPLNAIMLSWEVLPP